MRKSPTPSADPHGVGTGSFTTVPLSVLVPRRHRITPPPFPCAPLGSIPPSPPLPPPLPDTPLALL